MHISILFDVVAVLLLIGLSWESIRGGKPQGSKYVTAVLGVIGLVMLTQDVVLPLLFDLHHIGPFIGAFLVLWAVVAPVFRRPEDRAEETKTLLQK